MIPTTRRGQEEAIREGKIALAKNGLLLSTGQDFLCMEHQQPIEDCTGSCATFVRLGKIARGESSC